MTKQSDSLNQTPDELLTKTPYDDADSPDNQWLSTVERERYQRVYLHGAKAQLTKCHQSEAAIRADERKKIGEYIKNWSDEWDDISSWDVMRRFVSQLELGKFSPEGEK